MNCYLPVKKPKVTEFERVSVRGLVAMPDEERIEAVPVHFCHGRWYGPRLGGYGRYKDTQAGALIAEYGFSRTIRDSVGSTQAERAALWLMQNNSVDYAGPLSGYPIGIHEMGPQRVLVTDQLDLPKPVRIKWPTIQCLIETLFQDGDHDQTTVFYTWAAASFRELHSRLTNPGQRPFQHCPALAILGERGCGKSALVDLVLKPLFGGREADPLAFLREGKFNADLFPAALLKLDDKGAPANLEERRQRGDAMKALIWQEFQRMEGKGLDAIMVSPFWRLVIAANLEDSSLNVLPTLNESLKDKLILLRAVRAEGLPETEEAKKKWVFDLACEVEGFAHFLLRYKPPARAKLDSRTRVVNFWHPEIEGALLEKQPEGKAREIIEELFKLPWEGTATEFFKAVREKDGAGHYERFFGSIDRCGRILAELARTVPTHFGKTMAKGLSRYRIGGMP